MTVRSRCSADSERSSAKARSSSSASGRKTPTRAGWAPIIIGVAEMRSWSWTVKFSEM